MIKRVTMMLYKRKCLFFYPIIFLCLAFFACKQEKQDAPLFELMKNTGIRFSNEVTDTKDFNIFTFRNFYNGAGVAIVPPVEPTSHTRAAHFLNVRPKN